MNSPYLKLVYWLHSINTLRLAYSKILKNPGPGRDRVICEHPYMRSPSDHMSSGVVAEYSATIGSSTGGKGQCSTIEARWCFRYDGSCARYWRPRVKSSLYAGYRNSLSMMVSIGEASSSMTTTFSKDATSVGSAPRSLSSFHMIQSVKVTSLMLTPPSSRKNCNSDNLPCTAANKNADKPSNSSQ